MFQVLLPQLIHKSIVWPLTKKTWICRKYILFGSYGSIYFPKTTTSVRVKSLSLGKRCIMLVNVKLTLLLEQRFQANTVVYSLHPVPSAHWCRSWRHEMTSHLQLNAKCATCMAADTTVITLEKYGCECTVDSRSLLTPSNKRPLLVIVRCGTNILNGVPSNNNTRSQ